MLFAMLQITHRLDYKHRLIRLYMDKRRGDRKHNRDRFAGARLTDEERVECAALMASLRARKPQQFRVGKDLLVVLKDTGVWKEVEGSSGDLICCIVRNGEEHTWMRRGKGQTVGKRAKGCKQRLDVDKILWA